MSSFFGWFGSALSKRTNLRRWQLFLICFFIGSAIGGVIVLGKAQVKDAKAQRDGLQDQNNRLAAQNVRQDLTDQQLQSAILRLDRLEHPTRGDIRREIRRFFRIYRSLPQSEQLRLFPVPGVNGSTTAVPAPSIPNPSSGGGRGPGGGSGSQTPTPSTTSPSSPPGSPPQRPPWTITVPPVDPDGPGPIPPIALPPVTLPIPPPRLP